MNYQPSNPISHDLDISALRSKGTEFEAALNAQKQQVGGEGFPWYPYGTLSNLIHLDNLLKGWAWPAIAKHNKLVYAHKETLDVSWICHDDLAALMIAALERPQLAGRSFAVGGPETVRLPVLTRILSRAWNRPLTFESQSIDDFCRRMREVFEGQSSLEADRFIGELHRVYSWYNHSPERPFHVDMAPVLQELPVRLTPIEEWARRQALPACT